MQEAREEVTEQKEIVEEPAPQNQANENHRSSSSQSYSSKRSSSRSNSASSSSSASVEKDPEVKKEGAEGEKTDRRIRYKYCCKFCKHTDSSKSKKACVCVVPKDQRRTEIGDQGCQTCGCKGCSKQDFISRGQDPEYKPHEKNKSKKKQKQIAQFEARNGCCRKCMKAFSKTNKSCLCQVPEDVRNTKLPSEGCKICGCFGCNPEDKKDPKNRKQSVKKEKSISRSRDKDRRKKAARSRSQSSNSKERIDPASMNFYNFDKSVIGRMITNEYRLDPTILGFAVPQRSYTYITGKPK